MASSTLLLACSKSSDVSTSSTNPTTPSSGSTTSSVDSKDTSIADLMQYSSGSTLSTLTPMGNHYANKHVTTDEDLTYFGNAFNEPDVPASVAGLVLKKFQVVLYPHGSPSPVDVNQHAVGDCDLLAPLASLAYLNSKFIKSIIEDNGDGTFGVDMFDPQGKSIKVQVSSFFLANNNGDIESASGKNSVATWSTILEKAVMKYNMRYKVDMDIGGIGSEFVAPLFTGNGNSFAFAPGVLSYPNLKRAVDISLKKGFLVIGGFNKVFKVGKYSSVTGHGYTLMYSTDTSALFAMRNPWGTMPGSSDGTEDGVLPIPAQYDYSKTIDLRIIYAGISQGSGTTKAYVPPSF